MSEHKVDDISCDVCQDLIPLVLDHVASEDSIKLVTDHIETCSECKELMQAENSLIETNIEDRRLVSSIKKSMYLAALMLILVGGMFGVGLTNTMAMFYNFIIMPLIGVCSFFLFKKRWWYVPLSLFLLSYIRLLSAYFLEGVLDNSTIWMWFASPLPLSMIYMLLTLVGILIAALLKFAFKKERAS